MGQIIVSPEDFQDVLTAYLLELLIHGNPTNNELFSEIVEKMRKAGLKANLLTMFLDMNAQNRVLYKMIRNPLMKESSSRSVITVSGALSEGEE